VIEFNPFAYDFHRDPYPIYRRLRDEAPVYHNPAMEFWALSRFSDVLDALHDYRTYTSTGGVALEENLEITGEDGTSYERSRSLIEFDPPEHTALRGIIARSFTPRQIARLEPLVETTTRALLDRLGSRPEFDVVGDFTALLPTTVIATLLGFPEELHDDLRIWTDQILHREPGSAEIPPAGMEAMIEMLDAAGRVVDERRANPGDDLLSRLAYSDLGGRHPTDDEMKGYCLVLITGGHETTSKLIANGIRLFSLHDDQRRVATESPDAMRRGVEELLRYTSPTQYMSRTTTLEVSLHGQTIPSGAKVALLLGCGNRDEREFERPDEFDVSRPNSRILAFGHGAHVCLGPAVARLEARVALQGFLGRYPKYEVDEAGIELLHSGNVHGPSKMPVTVG
jgi:cytochrome P450